MNYTFHNVTVSVIAKSREDAYNLLCDALVRIPGADFYTDSYSVNDVLAGKTAELYPKS